MIQKLKEYLYNRDENSIYFIFILLIFLTGFLDQKYIISIGVVVYILLNMNEFQEKIVRAKILDDDQIFYNDKIHDIMGNLRHCRKYNIQSYHLGLKFLKRFFKSIDALERVDMTHTRLTFENGEYYLTTAINYFMTMTISVKEKSYGEQLKVPTELRSTQIGTLCKQLHKECYYILWNLSKKLNESNKGEKNMDRFKTYLDYNTSRTDDFDKYKGDTEIF